MKIRELVREQELYEALVRRARRNYRKLRDEIRAILSSALREELEAMREERAKQGGEPNAESH